MGVPCTIASEGVKGANEWVLIYSVPQKLSGCHASRNCSPLASDQGTGTHRD